MTSLTTTGKGNWRLTYNDEGQCIQVELWNDNDDEGYWEYDALEIIETDKARYSK